MNHSTPRIYLSPPHMSGSELTYIHEAFDQNWIAPLGANVDGFEKDLEQYTGRNHAAAVTSGTAAIHLALILCGVKPGDEVICPSFTFAASANPVRYQGATPVFVDSEPDTWNMDPDLLEQAILDRMQGKSDSRIPNSHNGTTRTNRKSVSSNGNKNGKGRGKKPKAIVLVHLYGMPARVHRILEIAAKYDIPVIEDAAESLGSAIDGRKCGTFGAFSILSFNGNKIITTSGGGALLSNREDDIKKARFLATQARDDAPHYQHSELGYNYRMSNIVAGIGRGQIRVMEQRISARRRIHDYYFEKMDGTWLDRSNFTGTNKKGFGSSISSTNGFYFLKEPDGYVSNRWLTTVLVNPKETGGITRDVLRLALEEENIESRPLWKPMHQQPLYKDFPYYGNGVSDKLFKYGMCLPSGSDMSKEDQLRVLAVIQKVGLLSLRSTV